MGKYKAQKKYRSTTFTPAKRKLLKATNYKELMFTTLRAKLPYFVIGIGVILGVLSGITYVILKNTGAKPHAVSINTVQIVTPTAIPPTLTPTQNKPVVDKQKAAQAALAKPGAGSTKYIVKKGDTLWTIAEKAYKSGFNYKDVVAYNKIANPSTIEPGTIILLPTVVPQLPTDPTVLAAGGVGGPVYQGSVSGASAAAPQPASSTSSYTVVKGDTLWSIAEGTYGSGFDWKQISLANNVADPTKLEPGTVLQLPR